MSFCFRSVLLLSTLVWVPALGAQVRSPFMAPSGEAAPAPAEDAPLQFVGMIGAGENTRYCVYDSARRRSMWLKEGDEQGSVQLQSFDRENRTLSVVQNGRAMSLRLQTAKVPGGGGATGVSGGPLPVAGANSGNNLVNTVVPNPTPADEAKRLEAVAAEVRRRRALRQQAAQNQSQPAPAPGASGN